MSDDTDTKSPRVDVLPPVDERPTISYRQALAACRKAMGPKARIWKTADGYEAGVDKQPGRLVVLRGPDLWLMLFGAYEPPPPADTKSPRDPGLTVGIDSGINEPINNDRTPAAGGSVGVPIAAPEPE